MTRVCFIGSPDVNLRYELLSRETSREALATYDLECPFENTLAVRTVSVGAAVSLLNDLEWYLVRFVDEALLQEPSVSEAEWLSRELAESLRSGEITPEETGEYLKIYGVESAEEDDTAGGSESGPGGATLTAPVRLVEPLYARRTDGNVPAYDLRDVAETLVVRLTEAEFSA
ncbi:DUF5804 family protein [Natrialbaceae archaeon AArc-T1-2]|uniref:DUF5804 family protein n=1 Tax=Natrialbaceae archaeon AArc-T1-2 TaxID=3053904 RepID=UPI00255A9F89|nr:DUF5804 family protein [Natrialbaceae archaeon AArc-T1-2]WIV67953.1 DUF5804 family protein [Natrialbaceae archaeon AArc-T1-2]